MATRKYILKNLPPEKAALLEQLRAQVRHAEDHGQHDTAHHTMLERLEKELGLIPARKIEESPDEVTHGKPDL